MDKCIIMTNSGAGRRSAVDRAAQKICDLIGAGRFVAGQRLPESDLVEQLGVSKTVVREVFAKLQEEGILELQMYKGATVRRLTIDQVIEIAEINMALLGWGMQRAAEMIARNPERAQVLAMSRHNMQTLNPRNQTEHLAAFYSVVDGIVELAGSEYLSKLLQRGLNPLFKEFLLDSVGAEPGLVEHTRKLDDTLALVVAGDSEGALRSFIEWSKINAIRVREELVAAELRRQDLVGKI
jgi:DNA-binding GntR family transcriptional regulator